VRWAPEQSTCAECGFDWDLPLDEAMAVVVDSPARLQRSAAAIAMSPAVADGGWSARGYLWHLVDVLRIGSDRLLTLSLDPSTGLPCWDENALAAVRQYERLSVPAGLTAYRTAAETWAMTARATDPGAAADHPIFGQLTAGDVIRRNSHEVVHHEMDIGRLVDRA
jgi:hypothetical protein